MKKTSLIVTPVLALILVCGCTRLSIPVGEKRATYWDLRNPFFERSYKVSCGDLKIETEQTDAITEAKLKTVAETMAKAAVKELKTGL